MLGCCKISQDNFIMIIVLAFKYRSFVLIIFMTRTNQRFSGWLSKNIEIWCKKVYKFFPQGSASSAHEQCCQVVDSEDFKLQPKILNEDVLKKKIINAQNCKKLQFFFSKWWLFARVRTYSHWEVCDFSASSKYVHYFCETDL